MGESRIFILCGRTDMNLKWIQIVVQQNTGGKTRHHSEWLMQYWPSTSRREALDEKWHCFCSNARVESCHPRKSSKVPVRNANRKLQAVSSYSINFWSDCFRDYGVLSSRVHSQSSGVTANQEKTRSYHSRGCLQNPLQHVLCDYCAKTSWKGSS